MVELAALVELAAWAALAELAAWAALAESAELAVSAAWAVSVELAASAAWAVSVERAASADPEARAESVVPVAPGEPVSLAPAVPRVRAEQAVGTVRGTTIPSIAAVRPMATGRRRIDSAATLAAHPPLRAKRAHASRSAIRAEIFPATAAAQGAQA